MEITGKGLRQGNKVIAYFSTGTVREIYERYALIEFSTGEKDHYPYVVIKGIPLTPELLKNCGFEAAKWLDKESPAFSIFDKEEKIIWSAGILYKQEGLSLHKRFSTIPVNFLHQLQNIVYDIAGEDLTVFLNRDNQKFKETLDIQLKNMEEIMSQFEKSERKEELLPVLTNCLKNLPEKDILDLKRRMSRSLETEYNKVKREFNNW